MLLESKKNAIGFLSNHFWLSYFVLDRSLKEYWASSKNVFWLSNFYIQRESLKGIESVFFELVPLPISNFLSRLQLWKYSDFIKLHQFISQQKATILCRLFHRIWTMYFLLKRSCEDSFWKYGVSQPTHGPSVLSVFAYSK